MSRSYQWHCVKVALAGERQYRVSSKCRSIELYTDVRNKYPGAEEAGEDGTYDGRYTVRLLNLQSPSAIAQGHHPDNVVASKYAQELGMIDPSAELRATVVFCIKAPLKFANKELKKLRHEAKLQILWTKRREELPCSMPPPQIELTQGRSRKQCPICFEPARDTQLACGHKFCSHCIEHLDFRKCPMCRRDVCNFSRRLPPADAQLSSSDDESYEETINDRCFKCKAPASCSFECECSKFAESEGRGAKLHVCMSCSRNWTYCNCTPDFRELSATDSSDSQHESSDNDL